MVTEVSEKLTKLDGKLEKLSKELGRFLEIICDILHLGRREGGLMLCDTPQYFYFIQFLWWSLKI